MEQVLDLYVLLVSSQREEFVMDSHDCVFPISAQRMAIMGVETTEQPVDETTRFENDN